MEAVREEEERKSEGFRLIGAFIFNFSQLEFTIRARLATALHLPDEKFNAVIAPYDFAMLCTVTANILGQAFPKQNAQIKKLFNDCRTLNDHRVRIAHGLWTHGDRGLIARHVSRQTLEPQFFYDDPGELVRLAESAQQLMIEVMTVPHGPKNLPGSRLELIGAEVLTDEDERTAAKPRRPSRRKARSNE
jgi:hypothetical protein